jgi:nitroreductase
MEFKELLGKRVSVRQFRPDAVSPDDIRTMVHLASLAPSPNNQQPWRFIAVTRPSLRSAMAEAVRARIHALLPEPSSDDARRASQRVEWYSTFFAEAPLVMAVSRQPYDTVIAHAWPDPPAGRPDINEMRGHPDILAVGAAVEHLLLAATELGYGSCWLSGPLVAREALEILLGIEAPQQLATLVAIGVPATTPVPAHDRAPLDGILRFID